MSSLFGYKCLYCGNWVEKDTPHLCSGTQSLQSITLELNRIANALEHIADILAHNAPFHSK